MIPYAHARARAPMRWSTVGAAAPFLPMENIHAMLHLREVDAGDMSQFEAGDVQHHHGVERRLTMMNNGLADIGH